MLNLSSDSQKIVLKTNMRRDNGAEVVRAKERLAEVERELEAAYERWQELESRRP